MATAPQELKNEFSRFVSTKQFTGIDDAPLNQDGIDLLHWMRYVRGGPEAWSTPDFLDWMNFRESQDPALAGLNNDFKGVLKAGGAKTNAAGFLEINLPQLYSNIPKGGGGVLRNLVGEVAKMAALSFGAYGASSGLAGLAGGAGTAGTTAGAAGTGVGDAAAGSIPELGLIANPATADAALAAGIPAGTLAGGAGALTLPATTQTVGALGSAETIPELGMVADPATANTALQGGIPAEALAGGEGALTLPVTTAAVPAASAPAAAPAGTPATATTPAVTPAATGATSGQVAAGASAAGALDGMTQADAAALAESGTVGNAGAAIESTALGTQNIDQFLGALPATTQGILAQLGLGSAGEALDKLMKLGLPFATVAGLFEKPNNPLLGPIVQAAQKAIGAADQYAALGPIGITPAQQQAIDLAKANVGKWQPYLDQSGALADRAAGGITQESIDRYKNPYLDDVLSNSIRDIEQAAARRREQLRATTSMSGNDLRTPSTVANRFNVEDDLLDQTTFGAIGDLSAKTRATAYDNATGLAGNDLDRSLQSSGIYGGLGKTAGALGASDVAGLTDAGALERKPLEDERSRLANTSKLYTDVVRGNQGVLDEAAKPSTLTQVTGALGSLKSAKDLGLF